GRAMSKWKSPPKKMPEEEARLAGAGGRRRSAARKRLSCSRFIGCAASPAQARRGRLGRHGLGRRRRHARAESEDVAARPALVKGLKLGLILAHLACAGEAA